MSGFKLDTSGVVGIMPAGRWNERFMRWSDLSPFAQGYIEAALREFGLTHQKDDGDLYVAFSDLAPAALAAMLEDCERMAAVAREPDADLGRTAWNLRQLDKITDYAPVTLYLADDGKIHQREAR